MSTYQHHEQFSYAFIRAIAAQAGVTAVKPEIDTDSVDFILRVPTRKNETRSPVVEVQVKSWTNPKFVKTDLRYPLEIKNYNELIGELFLPRYLIVVVIPKNIQEWLKHDSKKLALYGQVYWASLKELPHVDNANTVTVSLPKKQVFNVDTLKEWLPIVEDSH